MSIGHWLSERLRYLVRWPINLVRDFPIRIGRLFDTFMDAALGMLFFPAELVDAVRFGEGLPWIRTKSGRFVAWWYRLVTQLFDLIGGPELAQFFFHFFTHTSPLTADEIALMSDIIGPDALRYEEVRVAGGGLLDLVFRINGGLAFATWRTINMPRTGPHSRQDKSIVAHELTHVYQYERVGTRYLGEAIYMLIKTKRDCYNYGGTAGLNNTCATGGHYDEYNREQQAMIVQDYYTLTSRGADVSAYDPFLVELRAGMI